MNRQLKFRVWNKKINKWIHGPGQEVNVFGEMILLGGFMKDVSLEDLNDCVVLQYTGLKDKNSKEIYEGDILQVTYKVNYQNTIKEKFVGLVKFGECYISYTSDAPQHGTIGFYLETTMDHEPQVGLFPDHNYCDGFSTLEVIGNVFENPELLK